MREMLSHGADLVSLARQSDIDTLAGLDAAISRYADAEGWYNSPKQLCRGGDIRALTFCCMPVKECPLIPVLSRIGLSRDEYVRLKLDSVKGTLSTEDRIPVLQALRGAAKHPRPVCSGT